MALKLYKQDGQAIPAWKYQDDVAPPAGYTETDDPVDWDASYISLVGSPNLTYPTDFRDKISAAYAVLGGPTADQTKAAARWFVIDKVTRDTVYTDAEQKEFAEVLTVRLNQEASDREISVRVSDIAASDVADIDQIVSAIQSQWQTPSLTLGDFLGNGAQFFLAAGAGYMATFDASSDDEIVCNIHLSNLGVQYDGSNLRLHIHTQLFNTVPGPGDTVLWEVDYSFVKSDGTEDANTIVSGNNSDSIDVSARTANRNYGDVLSVMNGVEGASQLQITLRRNSSGAGADSYLGAVDIYAIELVKV